MQHPMSKLMLAAAALALASGQTPDDPTSPPPDRQRYGGHTVTMPPFVLSKVLESKLKCGHLFRALPGIKPKPGPPPTTTVPPTTTTTERTFENDPYLWRDKIADKVNEHREKHGVPTLEIDEDLENIVRKYFDITVHKNQTVPDDSFYSDYGKYAKFTWGSSMNGVDDIWMSADKAPATAYAGIEAYYDFDEPGWKSGKNKYAANGIQMLWKNATKIACGHAVSGQTLNVQCIVDPALSYSAMSKQSEQESIEAFELNMQPLVKSEVPP